MAPQLLAQSVPHRMLLCLSFTPSYIRVSANIQHSRKLTLHLSQGSNKVPRCRHNDYSRYPSSCDQACASSHERQQKEQLDKIRKILLWRSSTLRTSSTPLTYFPKLSSSRKYKNTRTWDKNVLIINQTFKYLFNVDFQDTCNIMRTIPSLGNPWVVYFDTRWSLLSSKIRHSKIPSELKENSVELWVFLVW